jgi:hypothetical protein
VRRTRDLAPGALVSVRTRARGVRRRYHHKLIDSSVNIAYTWYQSQPRHQSIPLATSPQILYDTRFLPRAPVCAPCGTISLSKFYPPRVPYALLRLAIFMPASILLELLIRPKTAPPISLNPLFASSYIAWYPLTPVVSSRSIIPSRGQIALFVLPNRRNFTKIRFCMPAFCSGKIIVLYTNSILQRTRRSHFSRVCAASLFSSSSTQRAPDERGILPSCWN